MWDAAYAFRFNKASGEPTKSSDVFRAIACAYAAAVLIIVPINNVVTAVFDAPVTSVDGKDTLGVGLLGSTAGDAVGDLLRAFACLFFCEMPLDEEGLSHVGEIEVMVELVCGPDLADFDSAMVRGAIMDEVGVLAVLEIQLDILKECGLVCFDGEVIMGLTLPDQVLSDFALSQQGIGSNILALDIDGIQERDGGVDLIGTLELFISVYGQGIYFFWV